MGMPTHTQYSRLLALPILRTSAIAPGTLLRWVVAPFLPVLWEACSWGWAFWELPKLSGKPRSLHRYLTEKQGCVLITKHKYLLFCLREPNPLSEHGWERLMKLEAWPCWTHQQASSSAPPPLRVPPLKMATNVNATFFELFCLCPRPHVSHHMLKLPQMILALHSEVIWGTEKGETGGGFMFEMTINKWFRGALDPESSEENPHFDVQVVRGKFARDGDRS